jgi:hypothetical protein
MSPVDLLAGHCQPTRHLSGLVGAAPQPAKHARGLATGGLLISGQGMLGLLAVDDGPGQLAGAVAGAWASWSCTTRLFDSFALR